MSFNLSIAAALTFLVMLPAASAQSRDQQPGDDRSTTAGVHYLNLRVGGGSGGAMGKPVICVEARVWTRLSLETCGTGAGLLTELSGTDIAHFRAKVAMRQWAAHGGIVRVQLGLGFAELEVGDDDPGFDFGGGSGVETAGPEASTAVQYLASLGHGVEAVASLSAGVAYFAHGPDLAISQRAWQPFVGLEIGAGF